MRAPAVLCAVAVLLAACTADRDAAEGADSLRDTSTAAAATDGLQLVGSAAGFSTPESAIYDPAQNVWFVTNINGSPSAKDGNGFISRLNADGTVDSLRWIESGRNGVTLNAPKGTALVGDTLWVADIDALRGFHARTGAPLATIEFGTRAAFLNDVATGPDGAIYVTDTGVRFTESGEMEPSGTHQVFRVGPNGRSVTTAVRADTLATPNGIAWDEAGNRLLIVAFGGPELWEWRPGAAEPTGIGSAGGGNDGLEVLPGGGLLLTSWNDSTLVLWRNGQATPLVRGLASPADIGIDRSRNRVAVPLFTADRVELYELPAR